MSGSREILEYAKTVAVVGASRDPGKPSGHIPYVLATPRLSDHPGQPKR